MAWAHLFLMACLPIVVGTLLALALRLRVVFSVRRAAAEARRRLTDDDGNADIVRGVLRVEGASHTIDGLRDAVPVALATAFHSAGRARWKAGEYDETVRAPRLLIDEGTRRVELHEDAVVAAGSRVDWTGNRVFTTHGHRTVAWASVADGDQVVARGHLTTRPRDAKATDDDYRTSATAPSLTAVDGALEVVAAAPPKVIAPLGSTRRHPLVVLAVLISLYLPLGALHDYTSADCADPSLCASSGLCHPISGWKRLGFRRGMKRALDGDHFWCGPTSDEDCRASKACREDGLCTEVDGLCLAGSREDCLGTSRCQEFGMCTPVDNRCAKGGDDCRHTDPCIDRGQCHVVDGFCEATTVEDCRASTGCRDLGLCAPGPHGSCVIDDAYCEAHDACVQRGTCVAGESFCVASAKGCRASDKCLSEGRCTADGSSCKASTDDDCLASRICEEEGRCRASEGRCVKDARTCGDSAACRIYGRCEMTVRCTPASEKDCRASEKCTTDGACRLLNEVACGESCSDWRGCREHGLCRERDGRCVAGSPSDCANSAACKRSGVCTLGDGVCVISTADCRKRSSCTDFGSCTADGGVCQLQSSEDCRLTKGCALDGRCTLESGRCMVAGEDCRGTKKCQERGECTFVAGACVVRSDADCASAAVCKRNGWCTAQEINDELSGIRTVCFAEPRRVD